MQFKLCVDTDLGLDDQSARANCMYPDGSGGMINTSDSCIGMALSECTDFVTTNCGNRDFQACVPQLYDGCKWNATAPAGCFADDCSLWNGDESQCDLATGCTFIPLVEDDKVVEWSCNVNTNRCESIEVSCDPNVCSEGACTA